MSRTEQRFISVCNELKLYRNMGDRGALAVATTEWRQLHDDLGEDRAIQLIREINNAGS